MIRLLLLLFIAFWTFFSIWSVAMNFMWIVTGAVYDSWNRTMMKNAEKIRRMPRKSNFRLRKV